LNISRQKLPRYVDPLNNLGEEEEERRKKKKEKKENAV